MMDQNYYRVEAIVQIHIARYRKMSLRFFTVLFKLFGFGNCNKKDQRLRVFFYC